MKFIPELEYRKIVETIPTVCVDLVIIYDYKCLLLLRKNEPASGQYWFPGGRILKLETIRDAAIRKAKEETNLDCEFVKMVSVEETIFEKKGDMNTDVHTINLCCHLVPASIDCLKIDNNHIGYEWIDRQSDLYHDAVNHPLSLMGFSK